MISEIDRQKFHKNRCCRIYAIQDAIKMCHIQAMK